MQKNLGIFFLCEQYIATFEIELHQIKVMFAFLK